MCYNLIRYCKKLTKNIFNIEYVLNKTGVLKWILRLEKMNLRISIKIMNQ